MLLFILIDESLTQVSSVLSSSFQNLSEFLRSQAPTVRWVNHFCNHWMWKHICYCNINSSCVRKVKNCAENGSGWISLELTSCDWSSQVTVYLGKRDFVDHLDHVDPVGELNVESRLIDRMQASETNFPDSALVLLPDARWSDPRRPWVSEGQER